MKADVGEIRRYDLMQKEIDRGQAAITLNDAYYKYLVAASDLENSIGTTYRFLEFAAESK